MHIDHTKNIIEVSHISFAYNGTNVLEDVTLNVHQGDYLGIIGPNGGGKTTLLKSMIGLLKPQHGDITLFGTPMSKFEDWQKIGYVPQRSAVFDHNFPATVREVVSMGRFGRKGIFGMLDKKDNVCIDQALNHVDMTSLQNRNISDLSGGQQQRVFIARSLASQPEIIFLDEPTVGVDVETQKQFYVLLKKLNQELDVTLVLVSHDINVIESETTEVACVNKTLLYESNPKEMKRHGILQGMYANTIQFIGHRHTA